MVDFRYVANLKMNGSSDQVTNWINTVSKLPKKLQEKCVFCPPVCYLESASNLIKIENYFLKLGSQNLDANLKESYTGGIAANMLRDIGCEYVIIGHSERRILAKESDDILSQKLKSALIKKYKNKIGAYTLDISKQTEVNKISKKVIKDFKKIDGLINNAAYTSKGAKEKSDNAFGSFENFPIDIWQKSLDINLSGVFFCSQAFGKIMAKQGKGVIVNIASTYGLVGADQRIYGKSGLNLPISYAATKGAIVNFTRYLAAYWHGKNIRVNTLSPGGVMDKTYQNESFIKKYSSCAETPIVKEILDWLNGVYTFDPSCLT